MSYDQILEKIDGTRFQIRMFLFFFLNGLPVALVVCSLVYVFYIPENYRCAFQPSISSLINNSSTLINSSLHNLLPIDPETKKLDQCHRFNILLDGNQSDHLLIINESIPCDYGYEFNTEATFGFQSASMQFGWICSKASVKPILTSCFMAGVGVGSFSGFAADRYGRRFIFLVSVFAHFICIFLQTFIPWTELFAIGLFLTGMFGMAVYLTAFVMATELMVPKKRNMLSISSFYSYSIAFGLSSLIAYLTRDWVWQWRTIGLLGILYLFNIKYALESPRWLATNGKTEEVKKILDVIAKYNRKPLISMKEVENVTKMLIKEKEEEQERKERKSRVFKDVFKSPVMFNIFLITLLSWFSASLVYYGISLSVQSLNGNLYLNNTLMGLVEIPGLTIAFLAVKYLSRPLSHGGMMILSGIFCMGAALLNEVDSTLSGVAGLTGKALNAGAFYIVYIHTAEIFPTLSRSTFVCLGSLGGRLGSVSASYIPYLADLVGIYVPYIIMSTTAIFSGFMTTLFLPETRLKELPESIEDTLKLKAFFFSIFGKFLPKKKPKTPSPYVEEVEADQKLLI